MSVPKIKNVVPVGTQILIEILNVEEILGTTNITLVQNKLTPNNMKDLDGAPQAYILGIGPKVDPEYGFKVGDRVMFSTQQFTPVPTFDQHPRARGTVDPHAIKAVLQEDSVLS